MAQEIVRVPTMTSAEVTAKNPTLVKGQPFYESDTGGFKVGDGQTPYVDLKYAGIVLEQGPPGDAGAPGAPGAPGPANTLGIGTVTQGADPAAEITGSAPNQTLNLTLPRGLQGIPGNPGSPGAPGGTGPANSLGIGTVTQGAAAASITGSAPAQTLNLVLPKGDKGDPGDPGPPGDGDVSTAELTTAINTRAPLSHTHPIADIATVGGSATALTFLSGDGTWKVPIDTNTTYTALSQAEAQTGTATTVRGVSAVLLKGIIQWYLTGTSTVAPTAFGQSLVRAADAPAVRTLLDVQTAAQVASAISTAVNNLIASAPGTMDTLDEIAAALGDDPNFATTITNLLTLKAPLAAPALTGAATLDGQAIVKTNDSRLADVRTPADNSVTSAKIVDGAITNADINASAAIVATKLAAAVQTSLGKADSAVQPAVLAGTTLDQLARVKGQGYNAGGDIYFKLATFPIDDGANYASFIISGRIGGWANTNMALWNMLIANRSDLNDGNTIKAGISALGMSDYAVGCAELAMYKQADKSHILYIRIPAGQYYSYDFAYNSLQAVPAYTGVSEATVGTDIWHLWSAPRLGSNLGNKVFGTNAAGDQTSLTWSITPANGTIPMGDSDGTLRVGTPVRSDHAVPKSLLDAAQLIAVRTVSGTTDTLVLADHTKAVEYTNAAAVAVTIPTNASVALPIGAIIEIRQIGAGQVTVSGPGGGTLNPPVAIKTRAQWSSITLIKRGTDSWYATGDLG